MLNTKADLWNGKPVCGAVPEKQVLVASKPIAGGRLVQSKSEGRREM